jgi:dephospho-CoA kinase
VLKIGLTGGIGSGKTQAGLMFAELGIITLDADRVAKQISSPGTDAYQAILSHFGPNILQDDGNLNRTKIRDIIFDNKEEKNWIETLLHPKIRQVIAEQIKTTDAPYIITAIPLLVESKKINFIDRILLIDTDEETQIQRATKRDNTSDKQIIKIIAAQASRTEKISAADDIITNNGSLAELKQKVISMHNFYQSISD